MSRRSLNNYQRTYPLLSLLERRFHGSMTMIVGNSQNILDQLCDDEHVPVDKLGLIYNGVLFESSHRQFDGVKKRKELGLSEDTFVLAIVANLIPYKGQNDLLAALGSIKAEMPQPWVLLAIGRDDGIGEGLQKEAEELGISREVRLLGYRQDVNELLRISDVALSCSHEEGFSNAILEAMAASVPVIATDVGGNSEAVMDGTTGLLVPPRNPGALAQAILRVANDRASAIQMGKAGSAHVQERFSFESCIDNYEKLYRSIGITKACRVPPSLNSPAAPEDAGIGSNSQH